MAAVAYDVAALALRGSGAVLNFPDSVAARPVPASMSASDIRAAAAAAAAELMPQRLAAAAGEVCKGDVPSTSTLTSTDERREKEEEEFMDEEEIFDMPNLLANMAEGMLMSPPRLSPNGSDDSPDLSEEGSLWNYDR